uniref:Leucine rich repeat containing 27 n=1 Tax=Strigops habroptila TaxID=2489341 RepID=A0A672U2E1_STRHB
MGDSYSEELYSSGDNLGDQHLNKRNSPVSDSSEEIRKAAEECLLSSSSTLDVSRKNIKHLTEEMYRLPNIKYLHLEGNVISTLPEDLFQKLPHLVWLDLRYNKIKALPPGIGRLTSLTALNLRHCPLEFPPKEVIQKGLKSILSFLRDSGNGNVLCMEPATSGARYMNYQCKGSPGSARIHRQTAGFFQNTDGFKLCEKSLTGTPPVEKPNLSELLQSSLDLSQEWPNKEERRRFQELRAEAIRKEEEELLAEGRAGAAPGGSAAGSRLPQKFSFLPSLFASSPFCVPSLHTLVSPRNTKHCKSVAEATCWISGAEAGGISRHQID